MAAVKGRTFTPTLNQIAATSTLTPEEVFNANDHGGPARGFEIIAQGETCSINIPSIHKTSWVTITAGQSKTFYKLERGIDIINAISATGVGELEWYPILD